MNPLAQRLALTFGVLGCAQTAQAHPHVFIDTGLEVIFDDQQRATGLRITWSYDDLTSLQIITDKGLDPDFDGTLTPEETAQLNGFDMHWDAGYPGDTYASMAGQPLALSGPADWTVDYKEAKIQSTHLRSFAQPIALTQPLLVQVYDPTLYVGYYLKLGATVTNAPECSARIVLPDLDAARTKLDAAIAALPQDAEAAYPALGADFAEAMEVTCLTP
ncbi:MAG: polyphosphate kinase [Pseudorhodobacter sp. PARRP1]|nr:MAG: polyphosphate kinase [Pseudorhodobacter sp. PARRP1]